MMCECWKLDFFDTWSLFAICIFDSSKKKSISQKFKISILKRSSRVIQFVSKQTQESTLVQRLFRGLILRQRVIVSVSGRNSAGEFEGPGNGRTSIYALIRSFNELVCHGARSATSQEANTWPRATPAAEVGFPNRLTSYPRESNCITRPTPSTFTTVRRKKEAGQSAGRERDFSRFSTRIHARRENYRDGGGLKKMNRRFFITQLRPVIGKFLWTRARHYSRKRNWEEKIILEFDRLKHTRLREN